MPNLLTPAEAQSALDIRTLARSSMLAYVQYMGFEDPTPPAAHHIELMRRLDLVDQGTIPRLMVFWPPGSAKSKYCSERFPAMYLGKHPKNSVLACSHTQELGDRFGRRVRNIFSMPEHMALWNVGIARDSAAASHWSTDQEGEYFAAGVGVAIAGRRCDIGLIDDPTKNREEADSLRAQERTWDWYINDFLTRLKPNASQVFICTRWNERDLAGRILEREANKWDILELGMEAHPNDPIGRTPNSLLWPEWFTPEMVEVAKRDSRSWQALYQQRPYAEEGDFFKLSWFTEYDELPENLHFYGASDYAVTEGHGDFTEHGICAIDAMENLYIVDWWRGQTTPDVWIEKQCDMIRDYDPLAWFGESGPIRRSIEPYLNKRMTERGAECRIEWLPSLMDKAVRCRPFQAKASSGRVFLPKIAAWKGPFLEQLTHFPGGRYDDAVDVCSLFGRGLELIRAPKLRRWSRASEVIRDAIEGDQSWMVH